MAFLSGQVALIIAKERPEWKLSGRSDLFAGESKIRLEILKAKRSLR